MSQPPRPRYGGSYCCAVGCHNSSYRDTPRGVKFHQFPKDLERRKKWEVAVNRVNPDKTLWRAKARDVLCSEHFVGGKKSDKKDSPSYTPTLFSHKKKAPSEESARAKRHQRFSENRSGKAPSAAGSSFAVAACFSSSSSSSSSAAAAAAAAAAAGPPPLEHHPRLDPPVVLHL